MNSDPPRLADEPKKREGKYTFNATLGAPVEIQFNVVASPAPTNCSWRVNGEQLVTNITNYYELLKQADPPVSTNLHGASDLVVKL